MQEVTRPGLPSVAVVTGEHNFDVIGFHRLFRQMTDVRFYLQDLDNLVADAGHVLATYDALVFYNFHQLNLENPTDEHEARIREALTSLPGRGQGLIVLHHGLLAFLEWSFWSQLTGLPDRHFTYHPDQVVTIEPVHQGHPITRDLLSWTMVDETYVLPEPDEDCLPLLVTDHDPSMRTLAWIREFGESRVFCLASGHDNQAYADPHFRTVLDRGIRWVARRF
jgi:trehalose utilization protein